MRQLRGSEFSPWYRDVNWKLLAFAAVGYAVFLVLMVRLVAQSA